MRTEKPRATHHAINRLQHFCRRYRYVLRLDIVKHFESIDHELLLSELGRRIRQKELLNLCRRILASGESTPRTGQQFLFPGDDLLALTRPQGLPIGNLTSQFWSNCFLHPLDVFVKRELSCRGYLRYVDDFALFSNSKSELWQWKREVLGKLAALRLRVHESSAQVVPVSAGVPWLGFVVFPRHRRLKRRNVVNATRRLRKSYQAWQGGKISFAEFDARVQGWINHARFGDTWGLRSQVFEHLSLNKRFERRREN